MSRIARAAVLACLALLLVALIAGCGSAGTRPAGGPSAASPSPLVAAQLGPTSTASPTSTPAAPVTATATLAPVPPISQSDFARGAQDAPVTLLVYSDLDCDLCAGLAQVVSQVMADHSGEVRWVFRPFPLLGVHDMAGLAAAAMLAAPSEETAWQVHDLLFSQRPAWRNLDESSFIDWLANAAPEIGIDPAAYQDALTAQRTVDAVNQAYELAVASGIPGVPFVLINDQPIVVRLDHPTLEAAVRLSLLTERQFAAPGPVRPGPSAATVVDLTFDVGTVRARLYPESAPRAVGSFLFLAAEGWYDGSDLYHIIPGRIVEGGDPTGTGLGDAGYYFDLENDPTLSFEQEGMLAMANEGPGTNSSRWFINLSPHPEWDGSFTIFGRVIDGLDLLRDLPPRDPIGDLLTPPPATLLSVLRETE